MRLARLALDRVPPVPDTAARQANADGNVVVFTAGSERWRYEGDMLVYYIRYAPDMKTAHDIYAAPRRR